MKLKLTIYAKSVLQLLLLALLAWFVYTIRGVLIYVAVAAIIALIVKPVTNFLAKRKIGKFHFPRSIAAVITLLILIALFTVVARFLVPTLFQEIKVLSAIDFVSAYENGLRELSVLENWLASMNLDLENLEESIRSGIHTMLSIETLESTISSILGGLGNLFIAFFSIVFMLFFFLKEEEIINKLLDDYLQDNMSAHIRNIIPKVKNTMFRYSLGLAVQMIGVFLVVYIGLSIAGVPSAIVIAVAAAFFNLIPYLGPAIGATFGLLLGLGQAIAIYPEIHIGLLAGKIVLVFAITQLTDNFIYQPLIFANSIKAHPLEIFIVISVAGLLGGVVGMIIAVPSYGLIRIFIKEFFTDSKFVQSLTKNV